MSCESIIFLFRFFLFLSVYGTKYNERMTKSTFDVGGLIYVLLLPSIARTSFRILSPRLRRFAYTRLLFELKV